MMARRGGYALAILVLVVVAVFWFAKPDRQPSQASQDAEIASATSTPVGPVSVAAANVDRDVHKAKPASIWRKPIDIVADDGTAGVPRRYQFAGIKRVQTGPDFEEWMTHFSVADQKLLRAFDKQFFGVYKNRTPDQIAWMAAQGYPMPEDILAAQMMGAPELRDLSEQGNIKATFLLKGRELSAIASQMKADGIYYGDVLDRNIQLSRDNYNLSQAIRKSDSPYRAFMNARQGEVISGDETDSRDIEVISGLYFSKILGDNGATGMIKSFINSAPNNQVRQHRQAVNGGALSLYTRLLFQHAGVPPYGIGCMKLFCSLDPYPTHVPGQGD